MASGYDISASASEASGSGTGATKFGNTIAGSNGISNSTLIIFAVIAAVVGLVFLLKKK